MTDPLTASSLNELTKEEFTKFVGDIFEARAETEEQCLLWVRHFDKLVAPHPQKNGLIFWPKEGVDDSPEGVVDEVERFCRERGLPGFKDSDF